MYTCCWEVIKEKHWLGQRPGQANLQAAKVQVGAGDNIFVAHLLLGMERLLVAPSILIQDVHHGPLDGVCKDSTQLVSQQRKRYGLTCGLCASTAKHIRKENTCSERLKNIYQSHKYWQATDDAVEK
jgi:hypothetical protein